MSANEQVVARQRLTRLFDSARVEQGTLLKDLPALTGVAESTLRRALRKPETPISAQTMRGMERAVRWPLYAADRVLEDPSYVPERIDPPLDPGTSSAEDIVGFLERFIAAQPEEYRKLQGKLDISWPPDEI